MKILPNLKQRDLHFPLGGDTWNTTTWEDSPVRVLVLRLSPFRDVIFSMTHGFLAQEALATGAFVDFAFLPGKQDRELLELQGIPSLIGAFSHWDWKAFDLILVSNAYTLEMLNLIPLFQSSGVPLYSSQRSEDLPLFVLGGANALAVQGFLKPLGDGSYDSFLDGIFFGEGEGLVSKLVTQVQNTKKERKATRLSILAGNLQGLWIPSVSRPVKKALCPARGQDLLTQYPLLNSEESTTARLQISYGCPYFCSFCFEGYDRKPYREVPVQEILSAAREIKIRTGARNIDLYSFNFNTHKDIGLLLQELNKIFYGVNFLSQRLDILDQVPGLLEAEIASDKRSYTLGIEGISQRQRTFYQKGLDELGLSRLLNRLLRAPIREIKLFYILSGHENAQDFSEFAGFLSHLREMKQNTNPGLKILFSFGLLVRMPRTPLAYDRLFLEAKDWDPLIEETKKAVESSGFDFRLAFDQTEYSYSQVLALGGYEVHDLLTCAGEAHVWYDRNLSPGAGRVLEKWITQTNWININKEEKTAQWSFPMEFITGSVSHLFLYKRFQEAKQALEISSSGYNPETCLGRDCLGCGSCTKEQLGFLTSHKVQSPSLDLRRTMEDQVKEKHRMTPEIYQFILPPEWQRTSRPWVESSITKKLLAAFPQAWEDLIKVEEYLWLEPKGPFSGLKLQGHTLIGLYLRKGKTAQTALEKWLEIGIIKPWKGSSKNTYTRWEISFPQEFFPDIPVRFSKYLNNQHIPHTLMKAQGSWNWIVSSKALGKKEILAAQGILEKGSIKLYLQTGPKADLGIFFKSFPGNAPAFLAEIKIIDIKID